MCMKIVIDYLGKKDPTRNSGAFCLKYIWLVLKIVLYLYSK